ncbi:IS21 family transposase [Paracoccaceae bacterium GXU_MW_L88]
MLTQTQRGIQFILQGKLNNTQIAELTGLSRGTVAKWRTHLNQSPLTIETITDLSETELRKYVAPGAFKRDLSFAQPDFDHVIFEHSERGVTLKLLHEEYVRTVPDGLKAQSYPTFCREYHRQAKSKNVIMSFTYDPGEMIQCDFVGRKSGRWPTLFGVDEKARDYDVFCAVSAKSRKTFTIAIENQTKFVVLAAFKKMLEYFGGSPVLITIDNFPAAVQTPRRKGQEAVLTPEFLEFSDHYGFGLLTARVRKPRDKGLVENAVGITQNRILAPLRDRRFLSLSELNAAIDPLLNDLNSRRMRGHDASRNELFEQQDQQGFAPLPTNAYEPGRWLLNIRVGQDYHVPVSGSRYSVPAHLSGEHVSAKVTATSVHLAFEGKIVATHALSSGSGNLVTDSRHMPENHKSASMLRLNGAKSHVRHIGKEAVRLIDGHFRTGKQADSTAKAAANLAHLAESYGDKRVEKACAIANKIEKPTIRKVEHILSAGIEAPDDDEIEGRELPPAKRNVRGPDYFVEALKRKIEGDGDV